MLPREVMAAQIEASEMVALEPIVISSTTAACPICQMEGNVYQSSCIGCGASFEMESCRCGQCGENVLPCVVLCPRCGAFLA